MKLLESVPLKYKLPAIIVGLSLVVGVSLQAINTLEFRASAKTSAQTLIETIGKSRRDLIKDWMKQGNGVLRTLSTAQSFAERIDTLDRGVIEIPGGVATLRQAYVGENAAGLPVGVPGSMDTYVTAHDKLDDWMSKVQDLNGYYDILVVDTKGLILYTAAKRDDYMTNILTGPYAQSGLGEVVAKALKGKAGEVHMSDLAPYAASSGAPAIFIATQVNGPDGRPVGAIAFQRNTGILEAIVTTPDGLGQKGEVYILGADGKTRTSSRLPGAFKPFDAVGPSAQRDAALAGQESYFADTVALNGDPSESATLALDELGTGWSLVIEMDQGETFAASNESLKSILMLFAALSVAALVVGLMFSRAITRPIDRARGALDAIAAGNLDITVADADRKDEIGAMAIAINGLLDTLNLAKAAEAQRQELQAELGTVVQTLNNALQDLATGDLTHPITAAFSSDYEVLRTNYNSTLDKLSSTISQVVEAAQSIRSRSNEIAAASEDLSRRTENQAAALEETAAALDQLTSSVKSAAEGSRKVEDIVRRARQEAEDSGIVVQGAVAVMSEIEKSSEQISQIIGAIDDIAFQTNLLALNAGVEAARAGDAGKGFAVVASEVRALAQRSSAAAKEIKALITTSGQHVRSGVERVGQAGEALTSIVGSVANISTLVTNIAAGAAEQSTGLAEINIGVNQLDQVTQQNAAMSEQSTAASHSLNQDATALSNLVATFTLAKMGKGFDGAVAVSIYATRPARPAEVRPVSNDSPGGKETAIPDMPSARVVDGQGRSAWQNF